ncbi:MAG: hypothetical protein V5A23_04680 [Halobacteriales archaeon]
MGRTNPTYRDWLRAFEDDWAPYRRALRRRRQPDFDRLFERAREHADAAGHANPRDPELALVLSMLLAHEAELRALRNDLATDAAAADGGAVATDGATDGDARPDEGRE